MKRLALFALPLALIACNDEPQPVTPAHVDTQTAAVTAAPASSKPVLDVYKSPTCGCCGDWVAHMEANGYTANVHEVDNLHPIKERAGLLPGTGSCHTTFVDGYVIEGHVPAQDVDRLLAERPDAKGLTVPGMPIGSPGMEMGDRVEAYDVLLFDENGTTVFSHHAGNSHPGTL